MRAVLNARLPVLALGLLLSGGCVYGPIQVAKGAPRPNVDLDLRPDGMALRIEPGVGDRYEIPRSPYMRGVIVQDWHKTLSHGFAAGIGSAFESRAGAPQYTLQIRRADLEFAPTVTQRDGRVVQVRAQITYQARLLDADGNTLGKSSGVVDAHRAIARAAHATANATDAVEKLYEKVAYEFEPLWNPNAR